MRRATLWARAAALGSVLFAFVACATPTSIVIVRHAEKAAGRDPALTEAGEARALALVSAVQHHDIAGIYASQYQRTRATAEPLARARDLTVTVVPIDADIDAWAAALAQRVLDECRGRTAVVVSHSNTVPALVAALGGGEVHVAETEYASMFVITHTPDAVRLSTSSYGASSR